MTGVQTCALPILLLVQALELLQVCELVLQRLLLRGELRLVGLQRRPKRVRRRVRLLLELQGLLGRQVQDGRRRRRRRQMRLRGHLRLAEQRCVRVALLAVVHLRL